MYLDMLIVTRLFLLTDLCYSCLFVAVIADGGNDALSSAAKFDPVNAAEIIFPISTASRHRNPRPLAARIPNVSELPSSVYSVTSRAHDGFPGA